jgi:hypothetical protein
MDRGVAPGWGRMVAARLHARAVDDARDCDFKAFKAKGTGASVPVNFRFGAFKSSEPLNVC